jgi:hypothetical protein
MRIGKYIVFNVEEGPAVGWFELTAADTKNKDVCYFIIRAKDELDVVVQFMKGVAEKKEAIWVWRKKPHWR